MIFKYSFVAAVAYTVSHIYFKIASPPMATDDFILYQKRLPPKCKLGSAQTELKLSPASWPVFSTNFFNQMIEPVSSFFLILVDDYRPRCPHLIVFLLGITLK